MSENSNVLSSPDQLIDRVITDIKTQFPTVSVSDYEPLSREPIETPAILLEVVEIGKSARASGGRKAYNIELIAHCVLGSQTPNVGREICNMALFLLGLVDGNAWGLGRAVEAAGEAKAFPGVPIVGSDGCERWIVQWTQKIHIGEGWKMPDFAPSEVYLSAAPNIGEAHKQDYDRIDDHEPG